MEQRGASVDLESYKYDVFLSFAGEDSAMFAEPLRNAFSTRTVKGRKIRVWFAPDHVPYLGKDVYRTIRDGLRDSAFLTALVSQFYMKKSWPETELATFLKLQVETNREAVLPLLLPGVTGSTFEAYDPIAGGLYYEQFPVGAVGRAAASIEKAINHYVEQGAQPISPADSNKDYGAGNMLRLYARVASFNPDLTKAERDMVHGFQGCSCRGSEVFITNLGTRESSGFKISIRLTMPGIFLREASASAGWRVHVEGPSTIFLLTLTQQLFPGDIESLPVLHLIAGGNVRIPDPEEMTSRIVHADGDSGWVPMLGFSMIPPEFKVRLGV